MPPRAAHIWEQRQAEKQRSRDDDDDALRSGRKPREQLREANSHFRRVAKEPLKWDEIVVV